MASKTTSQIGKLPEGISVRIAVYSYITENTQAIYAPALDLYGYGYTETEAWQSFELALEEYLTYTAENQTLADDLRRYGWQVDEDRQRLTPPGLERLLQLYPDFAETILSRPYQKVDRTLYLILNNRSSRALAA
ncbi:hypothetical protein ACO2Q8_08455 [Larkinella sp. VNQ87]|uniref:hypothetical protein n=1 Tax=Larkinella sp. VNQ87 TaxID=3400921 RepID=UPI003C04323C